MAMERDPMRNFLGIATMCALLLSGMAVSPRPAAAAAPDPVLEWIGIMNTTVIAGGSSPLVSSRVVALVSASVFDAVNDRSTIPAATCKTERAASRVATCRGDSGGLRDSSGPVSSTDRPAHHAEECIARGAGVDRKC